MMNFGGFRCSFSIMGRWPNRQKTNLCMDDFACLARVMGLFASQYIGPHNQGAMCRDQRCIQKSYRDVLWKKHKLKLSKHLKISPYSHIFTIKIMNHHESSWITLQSNSPESVADDSPDSPCRSQCLPSPCGIKALGCWRQSWTPLCRHCSGRIFWESIGESMVNLWLRNKLSGEESWLLTW